LFANAAAHLVKMCLELGVAVLLLGYPRGIARDKPGKGNSNMWSYRRLERRIAVAAENRGIPAFEIPEDGTSKRCARHGCEVVRGPKGLVRCPYGHTMHADVNAAMNILARGGDKVPTRVRVLSFIPTASKVVAVNGKKSSNPAQRRGNLDGARAKAFAQRGKVYPPRGGGGGDGAVQSSGPGREGSG
jgi:putative transposase